MFACLDVQYGNQDANAACVIFENWSDHKPRATLVMTVPTPNEYQPGEFYRRELPCLMAVLQSMPNQPGLIIVDGYVWLGQDRPGLGWHLHQALDQRVPIIGVAKTSFRDNSVAQQVQRGHSNRPLYVTATGIEPDEAAKYIQQMHGAFRIPTLIKNVDQSARGLPLTVDPD